MAAAWIPAERSQSENNRAMSKTAKEMNIATREQAQAFDQLGLNVMSLNERLERLERSAAHDGIKDAVKALHQGLSRLADQITATANNSASQVVQLTGNLEQLASRVGQARVDSEDAAKALDQRIDASERALDVRLSAAEKTAQFNTNALDHALEKIEASANQRATDQVENQRRSAAHEESLNRLEDSIARLEMRLPDAEFERRLDGIERSVSGMADRLEHFNPTEKFDASMQALSHRLESLEKDHSDLVSELRSKLRPARSGARLCPRPAVETPLAGNARAFKAPPFDRALPPPFAHSRPTSRRPSKSPGRRGRLRASPFADTGFGTFEIAHHFRRNSRAARILQTLSDFARTSLPRMQFRSLPVSPEGLPGPGRRSARAASEKAESERRRRLSGFRWGQNAAAAEGEEKAKPRYLIPAVVALIVVLAAAAALVLSQRAKMP